jgi:hypothetical protein
MGDWTTDEYGTLRWEGHGWTLAILVSANLQVWGYGPGVEIDVCAEDVRVEHETPYEGITSATVPTPVLLAAFEGLRLATERRDGPAHA